MSLEGWSQVYSLGSCFLSNNLVVFQFPPFWFELFQHTSLHCTQMNRHIAHCVFCFVFKLIFCFPFAAGRWNKEKKESDITVIYFETKLCQWEFLRAARFGCQNHSVWPATGTHLWGRWHAAPANSGEQAWWHSYHTSGLQCEAGSLLLVLQHPGDAWFWWFPSTHTSDKLRACARCRKGQVCGFCPTHPAFTGSNLEWRQPRIRNIRRSAL